LVWSGWVLLVLFPGVVLIGTPAEWPRWLFMWLLAAAIFAGVKWLTWVQTPLPSAPVWRHIGYLLAWPGLDAAAFIDPKRQPAQPSGWEWLFAAGKFLLGLALLWGVAPLVPFKLDLVRGWVGMAGIVFILHFGLFHLMSCAWRSAGVDARPLMHSPMRSESLAEFWAKRWNTAFRDLTHHFLFRPLASHLGPRRALAIGFLFSGVVHDLVISVPARGGFGGPTLFFIIQAAGLFVERSAAGKAIGLGRGWRGWLFTALVLIAPAPMLFHTPFIRQIVLPFMAALGAGG
jgi:hypothetical protein